MTDQHKRVTQSQVELWLNMPATQTYLQALQFRLEQVIEDFKPILNPDSAYRSHATLFEREGMITAFNEALDPIKTLRRSELYEEPQRTKEED